MVQAVKANMDIQRKSEQDSFGLTNEMQGANGEKGRKLSSNIIMGKMEDWLKVVLATVKNQDPMNPADTTQMASQFTQFGQIMGIMEIKDQLQKVLNAQNFSQLLEAAGQLDRYVEVNGSGFEVTDEGAPELGYFLPPGVDKSQIIVTDKANNVIKIIEGASTAGKHLFEWDCKGLEDKKVEKGLYRFRVSALDKSGKALLDPTTKKIQHIRTTVKGMVTGGEMIEGKPTVAVNGLRMPLESLVGIHSLATKPKLITGEIKNVGTELKEISTDLNTELGIIAQ
ncbi:flagellar hook assembly protein FlgD [Candidatus Nucleicultrix amoebiphila]|jgi:flagellar basal-body rod modification protein FlgD|uniref:Basal-body rod modification protein FlgD n=1 Tax=Candidatus Nucleicultrix amoebiphila FS5 TaxID=1414854 RepID=A0A1W6N637_9PROT|nr:flagellar hook capping FlgD N-terminal domain-containing protein [Candidatus Nucleicultrix amoebiphila]ARN85258.1 hypothetical protein GQ61_08115 [Candidatus Nucleicultrix amoebiphila FS5]